MDGLLKDIAVWLEQAKNKLSMADSPTGQAYYRGSVAAFIKAGEAIRRIQPVDSADGEELCQTCEAYHTKNEPCIPRR